MRISTLYVNKKSAQVIAPTQLKCVANNTKLWELLFQVPLARAKIKLSAYGIVSEASHENLFICNLNLCVCMEK